MSDERRMKDVTELKVSIRSVVRGAPSDDPKRKLLIDHAGELNAEGLIPDNWASDGSLKEQRETATDVFVALEGALDDAYQDQDDYFYYIWVQDWDGGEDGGYRVIYSMGGDLYAAPFSWTDDNQVVVDAESASKVRPITMYVDRSAKRNRALPALPRIDSELRSARDGMGGLREVRQMPSTGFEMREAVRDDGSTVIVCAGCASRTCADMADDSNAYEMEDAFGPWVESTVRGFASKTIRQGCDTAFLVNHGGVTMARTKAGSLDLDERADGLYYEGRLNPTRPDVQIIRAAVEDGAVDESSFAFRVIRQRWSDDYSQRWIQEISLDKGDVSPVNYGANPHTAGALSMRSLLTARGITERIALTAFSDLRSGGVVGPATLDVLAELSGVDADGLIEALGLEGRAPEPILDVAPLVLLPDHALSARADLERLRGV